MFFVGCVVLVGGLYMRSRLGRFVGSVVGLQTLGRPLFAVVVAC